MAPNNPTSSTDPPDHHNSSQSDFPDKPGLDGCEELAMSCKDNETAQDQNNHPEASAAAQDRTNRPTTQPSTHATQSLSPDIQDQQHNPTIQTTDHPQQPLANFPPPTSLTTRLALIARAFTSYTTFKTSSNAALLEAQTTSTQYLARIAGLQAKLDVMLALQRQGLLIAEEEAVVNSAVEELCEMAGDLKGVVERAEELEREVGKVGIRGSWEEERRKGR